jgi:hypothetical protein
LESDNAYLFYGFKNSKTSSLGDSIYFSFVSATTTGFGDIIPLGWFKMVSIIEVIMGLMLLAVVTSKLVSIKQDAILNELYELSFTDRVNKLRSSFLLFRQNLDRIISKVEDGNLRKRHISTLHIYVSSFEDTLREAFMIIDRPGNDQFVKEIDPVNMELIYNSVINSFEKINETVSVLDQHRLEWRDDLNIKLFEECIILTEQLFSKLKISEKIIDTTINDLNGRKERVISLLRDELNKKPNKEKIMNLDNFN